MAGTRLRGDRIVKLGRIAIAWIVVVLVVVAVDALFPPRSGSLDLVAVGEQAIFLTAILAAPFALLGRERTGYLVVALLAVTAIARYGPQWISFQPAASRACPWQRGTWRADPTAVRGSWPA